MKYYIPTSSLNFNNILSSESISPQSFYSRRGFGYSRWSPVEENPFEEFILLYDKPFEFTRPISDMEDHPMLIELDSDEEFPLLTDGIHYSSHTLYLNPWDCQFIFFDNHHLTIALSLSDSSLETKMLGLYRRRIKVQNFNERFNFKRLECPAASDSSDKLMNEDFRLNKMKGLLYGYYIGALLSTTPEIIKKLQVLREIQNIFASVLSSDNRTLSSSQEERLSNLFSALNRQTPLYLKLLETIGEEKKVDDVINIFISFGHRMVEFDQSYLISLLKTQDAEDNSAMIWLENEINKLESLSTSYGKHINPDNEEIITSHLSLTSINNPYLTDKQPQYYISWVNDILSLPRFNGKVNTFKSELSDVITANVKDALGEEWENSDERTFLNHLRRHVRGESFTLPWNNGLFSSISAVITKGEDWNQLLKFMQSKGLFDYRIAFSLYGVLNGFANLTRDFTDILLDDPNRIYISQVYKEFYGQLLGKDVGTSHLKETPTIISNTPEKEEVAETNTPIQQQSIIYPQPPKQLDEEVLDWQNMIRTVAKKYIKKNKETLWNSLELAFDKNGDDTDTLRFLALLNDFPGWTQTSSGKPCAAWLHLQQEIDPNFYEKVKTKSTSVIENEINSKEKPKEGILGKVKRFFVGDEPQQEETPTPDTEPSINNIEQPKNVSLSMFGLLDYLTWIDECSHFISDSKAKKQFLTDMKWFVDNYQEKYFDEKKNAMVPGRYFKNDRSTPQVIEHLHTYMTSKLNSKGQQWLVDNYSKIPINRIINYLKEQFNV